MAPGLTGWAQGTEQSTKQAILAPRNTLGHPGETLAVLLTLAPGQIEIANGAVGKYISADFSCLRAWMSRDGKLPIY
jgi:hypothetical protein